MNGKNSTLEQHSEPLVRGRIFLTDEEERSFLERQKEENAVFERKKEIIKFWQEYIDPMNVTVFSYIKSIITIELLINGTAIVAILSLKDAKYAPVLNYFFLGIIIVLLKTIGFVLFFSYLHHFLSASKKNNGEILNSAIKCNLRVNATLYVSIFLHFVLYCYAVSKFLPLYRL